MPLDTNTKLLLHANNDISDSSLSPHSMTNVGSVGFVSGTGFGAGNAFSFNGAGTKAITTPTSTDFDLGAGDWTIDLRIKWNSHTAGACILSHDTDIDNYWQLFRVTSANGLGFQVAGGGVQTGQFHTAFTPVDGTWYHIEISRGGATNYIFVNGISQSVTVSTAIGTIPHMTGTLKVGNNANVGADPDAAVQELQFSVGICRHTANFTPPTSPYGSVPANNQAVLIG